MEKKTLLKWLDQLQEAQERTTRQLEHVKALLEDFPEETEHSVRTTRQSRTAIQNSEAATCASEILNILGGPTHRNDLFQRVSERGFRFGGVNPENTFGAILSRDRRFKTAGRKGWWDLVERDEPGKQLDESSMSISLDDTAQSENRQSKEEKWSDRQ